MTTNQNSLPGKGLDAGKIRDAARGQWHHILTFLGISSSFLIDKHGPCPFCGGKDRWRWDDKDGDGSGICNQCGAGDGFTIAGKQLGLDPKADFPKLLEEVGATLDIYPQRVESTPPRYTSPPGKKIIPEDKAAKAALNAQKIWDAAQPATSNNPYLSRKGVPATVTLREMDIATLKAMLKYSPRGKAGYLQNGHILLAWVEVAGCLSTLEMIDSEGHKSALAGGAKVGGYWASQPLPEGDGEGITILVGEGIATVLSGVQAVDGVGVAALSSSNLVSVAKAIRERFPKAKIIILADIVRESGK